MALFVCRKLILQTRMCNHPVGLDIWLLVGPFVYFHTLCVQTAKALARLRGCAGSPEPSLVACVISTIISWAGWIKDWVNISFFFQSSYSNLDFWNFQFYSFLFIASAYFAIIISAGYWLIMCIHKLILKYVIKMPVHVYSIKAFKKCLKIRVLWLHLYMSHDMTKPTKWVCAQRRLKSAWASAQSDQSLRCALNG